MASRLQTAQTSFQPASLPHSVALTTGMARELTRELTLTLGGARTRLFGLGEV